MPIHLLSLADEETKAKMSMKNFTVLLAFCIIISNVAGDHDADHTDEPSVTFDYEDLTEIIEAINDEVDRDDSTEEDFIMQSLPDDVVYNYVYESHPDESLQKRSGHYVYRRRKAPKRGGVKVYYETSEPDATEPCDSNEVTTVPEVTEPPKEPCDTTDEEESIEYTSADESYGYVGSLKGVPGVHYPNYKEIPLTSFTCADKEFIPGFYADLETRCQVFHVCYPHRRESFLCPVGTIFNQPILACDYWYNGNCSSAPEHFDVNEPEEAPEEEITEEDIDCMLDELFPSETEAPLTEEPVSEFEETEPVEVTEYVEPEVVTRPIKVPPKPIVIEVPELPPPKPIVIEVPEVLPVPKKSISPSPISPVLKFVPVKAKVKKFTKPLTVAVKAAKPKTILSSLLKAKVVPKKAPVKVMKAKIAATPLKAVPIAKVVKAAPAFKKTIVGKKATLMKTKVATVKKPLLFKKAVAANSLLLKKAKLAKAKKALAAKVAVPVVSALTKKHLALSLAKMLKAHKLRSLHGYPYVRSYYKY